MERPDFVVHSYTKELAGSGTTTAGVVIGRNEAMFVPKGEEVTFTKPNGDEVIIPWNETLFWNVYYIKGAFLDADKAFEVLNGMKTYEMRVVQKTINTLTLAKIFDAHPDINVSCPALPDSDNYEHCQNNMHLGLPAALFTIDMEGNGNRAPINRAGFKQFFDMLEPAIGMQVSLGQTNTVALCPALTTHSELSDEALNEAGINQPQCGSPSVWKILECLSLILSRQPNCPSIVNMSTSHPASLALTVSMRSTCKLIWMCTRGLLRVCRGLVSCPLSYLLTVDI